MITGLSTPWCQVKDMDRSVAFYRDTLGLSPQMVSPHWSAFQLGDMTVGLHALLGDHHKPIGGWILGIECTDLKALKQAVLDALGDSAVIGFHEIPGGVTLDIRDPDGNPIQAVQRGITLASL